MRGIDDRQDGLFSYVSLDARVPGNHPLRPIRTLFDEALAKLTAKFNAMYAEVGWPSIAPERLLKADIARALFAEVYAAAQRQQLTSDEHFSVDGTLTDARALQKSYRRKDDDHPDGVGRNAGRSFHGEKRSNETHESRTDPQARMYRKSHAHPAKLCHSGQVLMENRNGLVAAACVVPATGRAERETAIAMLGSVSWRMWRRITHAAAALRWTGAPLATSLIRSVNASANALRNVLAGARPSAACARPNFAEPTKSTFTSC